MASQSDLDNLAKNIERAIQEKKEASFPWSIVMTVLLNVAGIFLLIFKYVRG